MEPNTIAVDYDRKIGHTSSSFLLNGLFDGIGKSLGLSQRLWNEV